ncbi:MAG: hypothetical protein LBU68_01435, partial [Rickettsiales bacterium]|nr:hypothetical protein [Rickettsiales bacterium]
KDSENVDYLLKRAELKIILNDGTSAENDIAIAITKKPNDMNVLLSQAKINFASGNFKAADSTWEKIISIDSSYQKYIERANYYEKRELFDKAIIDLEMAKSLAQKIHDEMSFGFEQEDFRKNVLDEINKKTETIKQNRINKIE